MTDVEGQRPVIGTIMRFTLYWSLATLTAFAFFAVTGLEPNSGVGTAAVMVSAALAGQSFAQQFGSLPVGGERWKLIFGSLFTSTVLSLVAVVAVLQFLGTSLTELLGQPAVRQFGVPAWSAMIAFVFALYTFALWLGYGWLARKMSSAVLRKAG